MKIKNVIKFLNKYLDKDKYLFISASIFLLMGSLMGATYGMLVGLTSEKAVEGLYKESLIVLSIYLFLCTIEILIFNRLSSINLSKLVNNLTEKISFDVYTKVLNKPAKFFEEQNSGELLNRINSDPLTISEALRDVTDLLIYFFTGILVFIFIAYNSVILAIEIVIYLIIISFLSKKYLPKNKKLQDEINSQSDKVAMEINETMRGIREIKSLGIKNNRKSSFKNKISNLYDKSRYQAKTESNYDATVRWISIVLEVLVFMTVVIEIYFGNLTIGFFIAITYYIYRFTYAINNFTYMSKRYQKLVSSIERINLVLDKENKNESFGNINKTDIEGLIEYENVKFKYSNEEKNIFDNFNLKIKPNQITAIVGKSGQGKTSLFNLLLRYFDVNEGQILIDEINIKDYNEESFRQIISIIRQDPYIFNKTIKENLSMACKTDNLEEIRNACKLAEIDDYIMSLPEKYDTLIGEGGVNLSGGQKQRLAIARALLRNSKIILFDEATSALDNQNQAKIKKQLVT